MKTSILKNIMTPEGRFSNFIHPIPPNFKHTLQTIIDKYQEDDDLSNEDLLLAFKAGHQCQGHYYYLLRDKGLFSWEQFKKLEWLYEANCLSIESYNFLQQIPDMDVKEQLDIILLIIKTGIPLDSDISRLIKNGKIKDVADIKVLYFIFNLDIDEKYYLASKFLKIFKKDTHALLIALRQHDLVDKNLLKKILYNIGERKYFRPPFIIDILSIDPKHCKFENDHITNLLDIDDFKHRHALSEAFYTCREYGMLESYLGRLIQDVKFRKWIEAFSSYLKTIEKNDGTEINWQFLQIIDRRFVFSIFKTMFSLISLHPSLFASMNSGTYNYLADKNHLSKDKVKFFNSTMKQLIENAKSNRNKENFLKTFEFWMDVTNWFENQNIPKKLWSAFNKIITHCTAKIPWEEIIALSRQEQGIFASEINLLASLSMLNTDNVMLLFDRIKNPVEKRPRLTLISGAGREDGDDKTIAEELHAHLFENINRIVQYYYLEPFSSNRRGLIYEYRDQRTSRKQGILERPLHGVMHATRVAAFVQMFHAMFNKLLPKEVEKIIEQLTIFFAIPFEHLLSLTTYAGGYHDTARHSDAEDRWDKESSTFLKQDFIRCGLSDQIAQYFAWLIEYKNESHDHFIQTLTQSGYAIPKIKATLTYLKLLLYCADSMDIQRCNNKFNTSYIASQIDGVFPDVDKHKLLEQLQLFCDAAIERIHTQGDQLYDVKVNGELLPSNFSLQKKIYFENAQKPYELQLSHLSENPVCAQYIAAMPLLTHYDGDFLQLGFNPFIHGTNSSILALLPQLNFTIESPLTMVYDHQIAPLTGELTGGGLDGFIHLLPTPGKTSFGKLRPLFGGGYNVYKIMSDYAKPSAFDRMDETQTLKSCMKSSIDNHFNRAVHLAPIFLTRVRQLGFDISKKITPNLKEQYLTALITKIRVCNFIIALGDTLFFKPDCYNCVVSQFDAEPFSFVECFSDNAIMQAFTHLPEEYFDSENKLNIDRWPKGELILRSEFDANKEITLLFTTERPDNLVIKTTLVIDNVAFGLHRFFCENIAYNAFIIRKILLDYLQLYRFMAKALNHSNLMPTLSEQDLSHLKDPYPLLLLSENEDDITLHEFKTSEYRARRPLKFGSDINMIATNTDSNQLRLMRYLDRHGVKGVAVLSYHDLKIPYESYEKPKPRFHHNDGMERLSWFAAKSVIKAEVNYTNLDPKSEESRLILQAQHYFSL